MEPPLANHEWKIKYGGIRTHCASSGVTVGLQIARDIFDERRRTNTSFVTRWRPTALPFDLFVRFTSGLLLTDVGARKFSSDRVCKIPSRPEVWSFTWRRAQIQVVSLTCLCGGVLWCVRRGWWLGGVQGESTFGCVALRHRTHTTHRVHERHTYVCGHRQVPLHFFNIVHLFLFFSLCHPFFLSFFLLHLVFHFFYQVHLLTFEFLVFTLTC